MAGDDYATPSGYEGGVYPTNWARVRAHMRHGHPVREHKRHQKTETELEAWRRRDGRPRIEPDEDTEFDWWNNALLERGIKDLEAELEAWKSRGGPSSRVARGAGRDGERRLREMKRVLARRKGYPRITFDPHVQEARAAAPAGR